MKSFNIETQTTAVENFAFAGNQQSRAESVSAVRVFNWRDVRGNVNGLPKYVLAAIRAAGYTEHCLGGTTYSHELRYEFAPLLVALEMEAAK